MNPITNILPLATVAALALGGVATTASAAKPLTPKAAMTAGIHTYAKSGIEGTTAKASKIKVSCEKLGKIGATTACHGSFSLTHDGTTVRYALTAKAGVFHNSAHSLEYHVAAKARHARGGLPKSTGTFAGFYQDDSGKP